MNVQIEPGWKEFLSDEFEKDYFKNLVQFVKSEYSSTTVYPPGKFIFEAFEQCPLDNVKVVVIGQDPYHGPDQAHGLSFSVRPGVKSPPSLMNIFKEIAADLGKPFPDNGDLTRWAEQGVLLLNATLTVRARTPGSHQKKGWEEFTDAVIEKLSARKKGIVYILWGSYAQRKGEVIDRDENLIIESPHPSPFSANRGFFGSRPFSQANDYLQKQGKSPIDW